MLKWNLTSKTFDSATQTSKLRKTTSKKLFFNPFAGLVFLSFSYVFLGFLWISSDSETETNLIARGKAGEQSSAMRPGAC